jgi:hypothetical protein
VKLFSSGVLAGGGFAKAEEAFGLQQGNMSMSSFSVMAR